MLIRNLGMLAISAAVLGNVACDKPGAAEQQKENQAVQVNQQAQQSAAEQAAAAQADMRDKVSAAQAEFQKTRDDYSRDRQQDLKEIDDRISPTAQLFLGDWKLPLKPSEYLARNVRATPLNGGNDHPLPRIMEDLPEDMIVFSSDFPHFEGFADPATHYAETLAGLTQPKRDRFFGGATADMFKRMGDPIC